MKKMDKNQYIKGWFTIVELVVVIWIISIISTISFMSFSSYLVDSRDAKRTLDIASISSSIDIVAKKNSWIYPQPVKSVILTYKKWLKDEPFSYLWRLDDSVWLDFNEFPKDPLSWELYVYWLTKDKKYYQLAATLEKSKSLSYNPLIDTTYANNWDMEEYAYVYWNYKQNPDIWNYLTWLILLEYDNTLKENILPKENISLWVLSWSTIDLTKSKNSSWSWIQLSLVENNWKEVPYRIRQKIKTVEIVENQDFYITVNDVSIDCPNCSN